VSALEQTVALGVRTNQAFLIDLLQHPAFQAGELHTGFLSEHRVSRVDTSPPEPVLIALALLEPLTRAQSARASASDSSVRFPSPWEQFGRWRVHG
jgi:acetyl/propionyl-CoA carboxylase alpha subunit